MITEYEQEMQRHMRQLEDTLDDRNEQLIKAKRDYNELKQWIKNVMDDPHAGPLMKQALARYKLGNFGYEEHTSFD